MDLATTKRRLDDCDGAKPSGSGFCDNEELQSKRFKDLNTQSEWWTEIWTMEQWLETKMSSMLTNVCSLQEQPLFHIPAILSPITRANAKFNNTPTSPRLFLSGISNSRGCIISHKVNSP